MGRRRSSDSVRYSPTARRALLSATAARRSRANQPPTPCFDLRERLPATHPTLSLSAQPCTATQLTDHSVQSLQFAESTLPGSHSVSNDLESVRHASFSGVQLEDSRRTGILMGEIPSVIVGHLPEQAESTFSVAGAVGMATKNKPSRDGITKIYYQGHEYTKRAASGVKITYTYRLTKVNASQHKLKLLKEANLRNPILVFFNLTTRGTMTKNNALSKWKQRKRLSRDSNVCYPELSALLKYDGLNIFLDGTFISTPKPFLLCVTLMLYDPGTHVYVPAFFALMTSRTEDCYNRLLYCIEFDVGTKPNVNTVVSDFESALISAVGEHYPTARIIGCLFHLKQAWRRKLKEYRFSDAETSIAMERGSLAMFTVIDPVKVELQGIAWVKANIRKRCKVQNIMYSQKKWRRFWKYFVCILIENFPSDIWNVYGMGRNIINRTNNPLERYHRELNARFLISYPALSTFASGQTTTGTYTSSTEGYCTDEEDNVVNEHDITGCTAIDEAEGKSDKELDVSNDVSSSGEEGGPPQYDTSFQPWANWGLGSNNGYPINYDIDALGRAGVQIAALGPATPAITIPFLCQKDIL
ncbi:unnamed protein product [Phytophthora fragariaefolia]|uniref:Unnamed protein product n=1 Tax=Phytophthora fragariaefolia TaxID=1490495 RepID=A0A9W6XRG6_9STRA|nr:unnamed protein product [Phytophthora fragariaefolia]